METQQKEASTMPAKTKAKRFPILISPFWRYLLLPLGAMPERCFAEIEDGELHVRFGRWFDLRFPLEEVEEVGLSHWPLWAGIGPRYLRGAVGLIGTYVNTVEVRFKEPQRVRMLLPVRCERLTLSMEDPRAFMAALEKQPAVEAKAA
jgi:hypothetical protein